MNGPGWNPAVEATLRMRPALRPSIAGRNSLVRWVSAVTLTWIIRSSVAASVARNGPVTPNPALLTSTSSSTSAARSVRSEEHTSELQSRLHLVCRLLLEKKKKNQSEKTTKDKPTITLSTG